MHPYFLQPESIQFIVKTQYCWSIGQYMIEDFLYRKNSEVTIESILTCLQEIFFRLNERDYMFGIKRIIVQNPILANGLTHIQLRNWNSAFSTFNKILEQKMMEEDSNNCLFFLISILHRR
jgi:hypothetical protein